MEHADRAKKCPFSCPLAPLKKPRKTALLIFLLRYSLLCIVDLPAISLAAVGSPVPPAVEPLAGQPLAVGERPGRLPPGSPLGLKVAGHGAVVVLPHVQIVRVHPGHGAVPESFAGHLETSTISKDGLCSKVVVLVGPSFVKVSVHLFLSVFQGFS